MSKLFGVNLLGIAISIFLFCVKLLQAFNL